MAASVEPIPDHPAATVETDGKRLLAIADYHAGIEVAIRNERGLDLDSRAESRREHLLGLVDRVAPDRLVVIGDLTHSIGVPGGAERAEVEVLFESLSVPTTLVKGNHDGGVEEWVDVTVTDTDGARIGSVGFAHGHTWPAREVLGADLLCIGHEHPQVRLEDDVGGRRVEPIWLRGPAARDPFARRYDDLAWADPEIVVFPAFNDLSGGTWVNVEGQEFLSPFLPAALPDADAYLLDGARLGDYRSI